jgi:hypothetical protein
MDDSVANMAHELVKAAYLILPQYEYCILTVNPTTQEHPLWKYFTIVSPKSGTVSSCVLYINNRFSESVTVRAATKSDIMKVSDFLKVGSESEQTNRDFARALEENDNILAQKPYIIEKSENLIGIAMLGQCLNSSQVVDQFDVARFINISRDGIDGKYVYLRNFIINPLFESQSRFVFRVSSHYNLMC